jgi:hypothetical protein
MCALSFRLPCPCCRPFIALPVALAHHILLLCSNIVVPTAMHRVLTDTLRHKIKQFYQS